MEGGEASSLGDEVSPSEEVATTGHACGSAMRRRVAVWGDAGGEGGEGEGVGVGEPKDTACRGCAPRSTPAVAPTGAPIAAPVIPPAPASSDVELPPLPPEPRWRSVAAEATADVSEAVHVRLRRCMPAAPRRPPARAEVVGVRRGGCEGPARPSARAGWAVGDSGEAVAATVLTEACGGGERNRRGGDLPGWGDGGDLMEGAGGGHVGELRDGRGGVEAAEAAAPGGAEDIVEGGEPPGC